MQREHIPAGKIALYTVILVVLFVLESANGLPVRVLGQRIDILPFAVASVALLDGPVEGAAVGLLAGALYDLGFGGAEGLYALYYLLTGIAAGLLGQRFLRRVYPSALLLGTGMMLLLGLWRFFLIWVFGRTSEPLLYLQSMSGQTLVAALFSPIAYLAVRTVSRRFVKTDTP